MIEDTNRNGNDNDYCLECECALARSARNSPIT